MTKFLKITLILSLSFSFSDAQNLVPNPSFEEYTTCPDNPCQIHRANGWMSFRYSPDFVHVCGASCCSVPGNNWGYQYPFAGDGYSGLFTFVGDMPSTREYMGAELVNPLTIGKKCETKTLYNPMNHRFIRALKLHILNLYITICVKNTK